jgi:hypothetical protein
MASRHTTSSPEPWAQYEARTTFLRVPVDDWPAVKHGSKTEFRATGRAITQLWNVSCPVVVVAYSVRGSGTHDSRLMVLEASWKEPLGAISAESLEREGFPSLAHFRRYWMARTRAPFKPLSYVQVYQVRAFMPGDDVIFGLKLLRKLYGEHLPDGT